MRDPAQQYLFEHYNPLDDRIGPDFFDGLPTEPGVYKMYGSGEELLYVGKAKNIRTRLFTYRRARVGRVSRKTIRLIRQVRHIEYELCGDEREALLRENKLIREYRPEYNRAKKSPETYYFVHLSTGDPEHELRFRLDMNRRAEQSIWSTYGAFKGHRLVRGALGSLLRLLYISEHAPESVHKLPCVLLKNLTPLNYRLSPQGKTFMCDSNLLETLFRGESDLLFDWLNRQFRDRDLLEQFIGKLILEDMEA
ncbi:MAG: GIY-YIG nuclease family protein, partial [Balneolaceae bacterium]|nr:GIY-YIG nuclease family protein [Balneolaceae bacterium]